LLELPQSAKFVFPTTEGEVIIDPPRKHDVFVKLDEDDSGVFVIDVFDSTIARRDAAHINSFGFLNCLEGFVKAMIVLRAYGFATTVPRGCTKYAKALIDGKWEVEDPIGELCFE